MCISGHVTIGGSVCMQMLTRSGWCPSNDIEVYRHSCIYIYTVNDLIAAPGRCIFKKGGR